MYTLSLISTYNSRSLHLEYVTVIIVYITRSILGLRTPISSHYSKQEIPFLNGGPGSQRLTRPVSGIAGISSNTGLSSSYWSRYQYCFLNNCLPSSSDDFGESLVTKLALNKHMYRSRHILLVPSRKRLPSALALACYQNCVLDLVFPIRFQPEAAPAWFSVH